MSLRSVFILCYVAVNNHRIEVEPGVYQMTSRSMELRKDMVIGE